MPDHSSRYNGVAMGIHLEAVYEQGVLRPLEPLALAEHQRVHVTVEERMSPAAGASDQPLDRCRAELDWLAGESTSRANGSPWTATGLLRMGRSWLQSKRQPGRRGFRSPFLPACPTAICHSAAGSHVSDPAFFEANWQKPSVWT